MTSSLRSAALAFDGIAPAFDERFGGWLSVAAQRRAVRAALLEQFPKGGRILEVGGGTGEDAAFCAVHGYRMLLTDPSPAMVSQAKMKLEPFGAQAEIASAEDLEELAARHLSHDGELFDGAFSNFAPLNCVIDLVPVARGLAKLLKPGACAMLVLFGTLCPGEMVSELIHGRPGEALRRLKRGGVKARLAKREFSIVYHRRSALRHAFAPWFALEKSLGIGVAVPPSGAEPWISQHPQLLERMEALDRILSRPLALLGDHVLYQFRRTTTSIDN